MDTIPETQTQENLTPFDVGKAYVYGFFFSFILAFVYTLVWADNPHEAIATICFLLPAAVYAKKRNLPLIEAFVLRSVKAKDLIFPICLTPVMLLFNRAVLTVVSIVTKGRAIEIAQSMPGVTIPDSLPIALVILAVLIPITEEMLYRGFMLRGFRQWEPDGQFSFLL